MTSRKRQSVLRTRAIAAFGAIGVFLSWLFGILDFRQALWVVVAIAGIAAAPTIVAAIWTT